MEEWRKRRGRGEKENGAADKEDIRRVKGEKGRELKG